MCMYQDWDAGTCILVIYHDTIIWRLDGWMGNRLPIQVCIYLFVLCIYQHHARTTGQQPLMAGSRSLSDKMSHLIAEGELCESTYADTVIVLYVMVCPMLSRFARTCMYSTYSVQRFFCISLGLQNYILPPFNVSGQTSIVECIRS
jgi:hypothetical protein